MKATIHGKVRRVGSSRLLTLALSIVVVAGISLVPFIVPVHAEALGTWTPTTSQNSAGDGESCVTNSGYMYCVGGFGSGFASSSLVRFAQLSESGGISGSWTATTSYPTTITALSCVANSGYIYCVGGEAAGNPTSSVYYAPLSSSGVGAWTPTDSYPLPIDTTSCLVSLADSPTIFCVGGEDSSSATYNQVYYASLSSSGIGTWFPTTSYPFELQGLQCGYYAGNIYCVAPGLSNRSYGASSSSGGVSSWSPIGNGPSGVSGYTCVFDEGYDYCIGGYNTSTFAASNSVSYAQLTGSGLSAWTSTTPYPTAVESAGCAVDSVSNYMYCAGGNIGGGTLTSAVYYALPNGIISTSTSSTTTTPTVTVTSTSTTTETTTVTSTSTQPVTTTVTTTSTQPVTTTTTVTSTSPTTLTSTSTVTSTTTQTLTSSTTQTSTVTEPPVTTTSTLTNTQTSTETSTTTSTSTVSTTLPPVITTTTTQTIGTSTETATTTVATEGSLESTILANQGTFHSGDTIASLLYGLQVGVGGIQTSVGGLISQVSDLQATVNSDFASVTFALTNIQNNLTILSSSLSSGFATVEATLSSIANSISGLQSSVNGISTQLSHLATVTTTSTVATSTSTVTSTATTSLTQTQTATVTSDQLLGSTTVLTCDKASLNAGQNTNCVAITTITRDGVPDGAITFTAAPGSVGTFNNLNCQVQQIPGPATGYQLQCQVQFQTPNTLTTGATVQVLASYSGGSVDTGSSSTFSIVVTPQH